MWNRIARGANLPPYPEKILLSDNLPLKRTQAQTTSVPRSFFLFKRKKKSLFGDDLLSQGVTPQVPSALMSLTAGFEM